MTTNSSSVASTIYHNPSCSKSRATLALLREHGVEPQVIEYLKSPPSVGELKTLLGKLGLRPAQLLRSSEAEFKKYVAGKNFKDDELLKLMVKYPVLIERPIVIVDGRAKLGRPPENVLDLLK